MASSCWDVPLHATLLYTLHDTEHADHQTSAVVIRDVVRVAVLFTALLQPIATRRMHVPDRVAAANV